MKDFKNSATVSLIVKAIALMMVAIGLTVNRTHVSSPTTEYETSTAPPTYETSSVSEYETVVESTEPEIEWIDFVATAYCPCEKCCGIWATMRELDKNGEPIVRGATGVTLKQGVSVAADTTYPIGTTLEIEGMGTYIVHDRGGAIKGNRIDVYFNNHSDALEFGVQNVRVRVVTK